MRRLNLVCPLCALLYVGLPGCGGGSDGSTNAAATSGPTGSGSGGSGMAGTGSGGDGGPVATLSPTPAMARLPATPTASAMSPPRRSRGRLDPHDRRRHRHAGELHRRRVRRRGRQGRRHHLRLRARSGHDHAHRDREGLQRQGTEARHRRRQQGHAERRRDSRASST